MSRPSNVVSSVPSAPMTSEILSVGMVTPFGSSAAQTAASVRAGISRMSESFIDESNRRSHHVRVREQGGSPSVVRRARGCRNLPPERRRLLRIASPAFLEALGAFSDPVPVFVGAPEARPNGEHAVDLDFLAQVATQTGRAVDMARSRVVTKGRAAGLLVLQQAAGDPRARRGAVHSRGRRGQLPR